MADTVQLILERMVPELEDLQRRGLFTEAEIKAVIARRRDHEYAFVKRSPSQDDYVRALEYELALEALRRARRERLGLRRTTLSDHAGQRRVHFIFDRACRKFRGDVRWWLQWLDFSMRCGSSKAVGKILARGLQLHPRSEELWLQAASFEADRQRNITAARTLLLRALRINRGGQAASGAGAGAAAAAQGGNIVNDAKCQRLWLAYFRLECMYVQLVRGRRALLGLPLGAAAAGTAGTAGTAPGATHDAPLIAAAAVRAAAGEKRAEGGGGGGDADVEGGNDDDDDGAAAGAGGGADDDDDDDNDEDDELAGGKSGADAGGRAKPSAAGVPGGHKEEEEDEEGGPVGDTAGVVDAAALAGLPSSAGAPGQAAPGANSALASFLENADARTAFFAGSVPRIVFEQAVRAFPADLSLRVRFLEACDSFVDAASLVAGGGGGGGVGGAGGAGGASADAIRMPAFPSLSAHILTSIAADFGSDPRAWLVLSSRPSRGLAEAAEARANERAAHAAAGSRAARELAAAAAAAAVENADDEELFQVDNKKKKKDEAADEAAGAAGAIGAGAAAAHAVKGEDEDDDEEDSEGAGQGGLASGAAPAHSSVQHFDGRGIPALPRNLFASLEDFSAWLSTGGLDVLLVAGLPLPSARGGGAAGDGGEGDDEGDDEAIATASSSTMPRLPLLPRFGAPVWAAVASGSRPEAESASAASAAGAKRKRPDDAAGSGVRPGAAAAAAQHPAAASFFSLVAPDAVHPLPAEDAALEARATAALKEGTEILQDAIDSIEEGPPPPHAPSAAAAAGAGAGAGGGGSVDGAAAQAAGGGTTAIGLLAAAARLHADLSVVQLVPSALRSARLIRVLGGLAESCGAAVRRAGALLGADPAAAASVAPAVLRLGLLRLQALLRTGRIASALAASSELLAVLPSSGAPSIIAALVRARLVHLLASLPPAALALGLDGAAAAGGVDAASSAAGGAAKKAKGAAGGLSGGGVSGGAGGRAARGLPVPIDGAASFLFSSELVGWRASAASAGASASRAHPSASAASAASAQRLESASAVIRAAMARQSAVSRTGQTALAAASAPALGALWAGAIHAALLEGLEKAEKGGLGGGAAGLVVKAAQAAASAGLPQEQHVDVQIFALDAIARLGGGAAGGGQGEGGAGGAGAKHASSAAAAEGLALVEAMASVLPPSAPAQVHEHGAARMLDVLARVRGAAGGPGASSSSSAAAAAGAAAGVASVIRKALGASLARHGGSSCALWLALLSLERRAGGPGAVGASSGVYERAVRALGAGPDRAMAAEFVRRSAQ